jgi:AcrR family transcriptional regulator
VTETETTHDLRHARRERGVNAVLETALEIFMDGNERPTATEIARRAGVSTSSLFRYFSSIDDLRAQVAERYMEEHQDVLEPHPPDGADYQERLRLFVDLRIRAGSTLGPVNRRMQGRVFDEPALIPIQTRFRAILATQIETHFESELARVTPARRADLIALLDSMTSIEAFRILHETHDRTESQVRRSWLPALDAILRST